MDTAFGVVSSFLKDKVLSVQEFTLLGWRAVRNVGSPPRYFVDTVQQMDAIGVGSLPIIVLTGFFIGAVLVLQMSRTLQTFGEVALTGQMVAVSLVREIGPVLTALMVAGRNASGIASELGSMVVSEQIEAMRALGTDPTRKLVTPRLLATVGMLPLLTIVADFVGLIGGFFVSYFVVRMNPAQYWSSAYQALEYEDLFQGLMKPVFFAAIVSLVGCYYGLTTRGGTEGVGRSTTQAVVASSVFVLVADFFLTKILLWVTD